MLQEHDAAPSRPWDAFASEWDWQQGEHVSLVGPTGAGKTTLALQLLDRRGWVAVFGTKPRDATLDKLRRDGYRKVGKWADAAGHRRVLLWPRIGNVKDLAGQRDQFAAALSDIFTAGGWCVYVDELRYLCAQLGLRAHVELLWLQGRSLGVSLVAGTQRPAFVPLEMYSQATHLFFWRDQDEANLKRIAGTGWHTAKLIREAVATLPEHHVLSVNTRTGELVVTNPPAR